MISSVGSCGKVMVSGVWVHRNKNARLEISDVAENNENRPLLDTRPHKYDDDVAQVGNNAVQAW